jgi:hypothetical protein
MVTATLSTTRSAVFGDCFGEGSTHARRRMAELFCQRDSEGAVFASVFASGIRVYSVNGTGTAQRSNVVYSGGFC